MLRQFRPYVRLSVTCVDCIKTAEHIIKILSLSDRITLLVFRHQGSLRKSDGLIHRQGAEYKGGRVAIFNQCGYIFDTVIDTGIFTMEDEYKFVVGQCGYIFDTVIDTGIFTMEDEYKFVCSLSNIAAFDDLE